MLSNLQLIPFSALLLSDGTITVAWGFDNTLTPLGPYEELCDCEY